MVFKKGHKVFQGTEQTRFKKGQVPWNKNKVIWNKKEHPMLGKKHSNEAKVTMSMKRKEWLTLHNHPMKGKKHREESKKKMSDAHEGLISDDKNPKWKGGVSVNYKYSKYFKIRDSLLKNNKICSLCNNTVQLVGHHIDGDTRNNDFSNLIVICRSCHSKIHRNKMVLSC